MPFQRTTPEPTGADRTQRNEQARQNIRALGGARIARYESNNRWPAITLMCRKLHPIVQAGIQDIGGYWQLVAVDTPEFDAGGSYCFSSSRYETLDDWRLPEWDLPYPRLCAWNLETCKAEELANQPQTCNRPIYSMPGNVCTCVEHGSLKRSRIGSERTTFVCLRCHRDKRAVAVDGRQRVPKQFTRSQEDLLKKYGQAAANGKWKVVVEPI